MSVFKRILYLLSELFTQVVTSPVLIRSSFFNSFYVWTYFKIKKILERDEFEYFLATVKPGMTVFDIGANIGFFTIEFSQLVGPKGKVYAFEPDPFIFSLLKKNIERRNLQNVILHNIAVSDKEGHLDFFVNNKNRADNRVYSSPNEHRTKIVVDAKSIDSIVPADVKVNFIKIDIQGYELFALKGMSKIISNSGNCILFSEFWPYGMQLCGYKGTEYLDELIASRFQIKYEDDTQILEEKNFKTFTESFPMNDFGYTNLICKKL
ncbi:MAG: FkbM family methyltransferase [Bacteroidota bacterium]|nr:FkbM family methyltransferase [Bacteroidota bacterium]